jgi:hypothetical protein
MLLKAKIIITNSCMKINPFFMKNICNCFQTPFFLDISGEKRYTKGEKMYIMGKHL